MQDPTTAGVAPLARPVTSADQSPSVSSKDAASEEHTSDQISLNTAEILTLLREMKGVVERNTQQIAEMKQELVDFRSQSTQHSSTADQQLAELHAQHIKLSKTQGLIGKIVADVHLPPSSGYMWDEKEIFTRDMQENAL